MKTFKLSAIALMGLGLAACQKEETGKTIVSGDPVEVSVTLQGSSSILSRANGNPIPGTDAENAIKVVEFFVYNEDGSKDTTYPYFSPTSPTTGTHTFLVSAGTNKKFLAAINQSLGEAAVEDTYDEMVEVLANKMLFTASDNYSQTAIEATVGYGMAGEGVQTVVAGQTNKLSITVSRVLSRVRSPKVNGGGSGLEGGAVFPAANVTPEVLDEYLTEIFGDDYKNLGAPVQDLKWAFTGYVLINGIDRSYAFDNKNTWDPAGRQYFKTQYVTGSDGKTLESVYGGATGGDLFHAAGNTDEIFVYENSPGLAQSGGSGGTVFKQDEVTAFLIKGAFSATNINSGTPVTRYWRVNLIKDDIWKIFRNCVYEITMNTINTPGFETPKEAEEDGPIVHPNESSISIDLNIAPWGYKTQGVDL